MTGKNFKQMKNENGSVIVEASFVFPIMFIVLIFLIYMGNAFYIKAQMEALVSEEAIKGAAYCADPLLENLKETGKFPALKELNTQPYYCLFSGMDNVEKKINGEVKKKFSEDSTSFFTNMKPKLVTAASNISKYNNYVVYATFSVEIKYEIKFPISMLGENTPPLLTLTARAEAPVDNTAEFIRNTDMVLDLFHKTKLASTIESVFGKINDFICTFASK